MKTKFNLLVLVLVVMCNLAWSQKPKTKKKGAGTTAKELSVAEKMPYKRINEYWGPGTYYSFAPGKPNEKMVANSVTAMRDLTGISREDCFTELAKQSFTQIPYKEVPKWVNGRKEKDLQFFYSADKSMVLQPIFEDMFNAKFVGKMPYSTVTICAYKLLPVQDSAKVMAMAWQYMRELYDLKVLMSFRSTFKKADPKAWPAECTASSGWTGLRAGMGVMRMVDGKPRVDYTRHEAILKRTIGKAEFHWIIDGTEADFNYFMDIKLQKDGYLITYTVMAPTLKNIEPGTTWEKQHQMNVKIAQDQLNQDKQLIDTYKKAPMPPVLEDLKMLLHTR